MPNHDSIFPLVLINCTTWTVCGLFPDVDSATAASDYLIPAKDAYLVYDADDMVKHCSATQILDLYNSVADEARTVPHKTKRQGADEVFEVARMVSLQECAQFRNDEGVKA